MEKSDFTHRKCNRCGVELTDENWYEISKKNGDYVCKKCYRIRDNEYRKNRYKTDETYRKKIKKFSRDNFQKHKAKRHLKHKEWYNKNKELVLLIGRRNAKKERERIIQKLGGKCVVCSERDLAVLELDHIIPLFNSKGRETTCIEEAKKNPEKFQVLCANCHRRKTLNDLKEYWEEKRRMPVLP